LPVVWIQRTRRATISGTQRDRLPWSIIDATILVPNLVPNPIVGLCNVTCGVTLNGRSVARAVFTATLEDDNNSVHDWLAARTIDTATTSESGYCILTLIQHAQFTRGGVYRIIGKDPKGRVFLNRRVIIPNTQSAQAENLQDEPEQIV
jgi:hypothetical protein